MKTPKKKKAKTEEAGSVFEHVNQRPLPIQDPLKTEKYYSDSGERMTRVTYHLNPCPVEVSVENLMIAARDYPNFLVSRNAWHFILPWLGCSDGIIRKFWQCYKREAAELGRKKAIDGSTSFNRQNEQNLIRIVHEYKALSIKKYGFDLAKNELPSVLANVATSESERLPMMQALKEKMVDWVLEAVWNDPKAPKRLHELLENKKAAHSEYSEQPTVSCRFFNAFAREISEHWSLPTKKAVRNGAGLGDADEDETAAARAFRQLGLSGLPEA